MVCRLRAPDGLNDPRTPLLLVVPSHELGALLGRIELNRIGGGEEPLDQTELPRRGG